MEKCHWRPLSPWRPLSRDSYINNLSPQCHTPRFPFLLFIILGTNFFGMKKPICYILFVMPLILTDFITLARIFLFDISIILYNPKAILFFLKIEILGYIKFSKRKFLLPIT